MPEWTSHIRPHLAALRLDPSREAEILDEISQHMDARYEDLLRNGATEAEAQRLVTEELCVPDALAEFMRPLRQSHAPLPLTPGTTGTHVFRGLWQDLRIAARSLKKTPVFATAASTDARAGHRSQHGNFQRDSHRADRPARVPRTRSSRLDSGIRAGVGRVWHLRTRARVLCRISRELEDARRRRLVRRDAVNHEGGRPRRAPFHVVRHALLVLHARCRTCDWPAAHRER